MGVLLGLLTAMIVGGSQEVEFEAEEAFLEGDVPYVPG